MKVHLVIVVALTCLTLNKVKAQINFPSGNSLSINSNNELMYSETRLFFTTGKFKASDYHWAKQLDSLDNRWFVTSCFNGDCRNDLLQSGNFVTDFGINDTTCFIAFHVETKGYTGLSKIKYKVYNNKIPSDSAELNYMIAYSNPLSIQYPVADQIKIPNPMGGWIKIYDLKDDPDKIILRDVAGRMVKQWTNLDYDLNSIKLSVEDIEAGYYHLWISSENYLIQKKILIQSF